MKLLKTQYQDILHALEYHNIPPESLSLIKRKGRIRVAITGRDLQFEFFRRKSVSITPSQRQWANVEHYELTFSGERKNVPTWSDVLREFKLWLVSFSKTL